MAEKRDEKGGRRCGRGGSFEDRVLTCEADAGVEGKVGDGRSRGMKDSWTEWMVHDRVTIDCRDAAPSKFVRLAARLESLRSLHIPASSFHSVSYVSPRRYGIALTNRSTLQNEFECPSSLRPSPRFTFFSTFRSSSSLKWRTYPSSSVTDCVAQYQMVLPFVLMLVERYKLAKCVRACQ